MRSVLLATLLLLVTVLFSGPSVGQAEEVGSWTLPGEGAGPLVVNPVDGSLWTFFHQTGNLVALDTSDGSVRLDVPLTIRPTSLAFSADGRFAYLVGEPLDDQIIDRGLVQVISAADGRVIAELAMEGACNAVHVAESGAIYVACGMQYAYQGTVYKLAVNTDNTGRISLAVENQAACGKIPWAVATFEGNLYVTDLELQWTSQPDGSMGPPYGSWVWIYDAETLEFIDRSWVGINPSRLAMSGSGMLVACSGSKQGGDAWAEPALSLLRSPGESEPILIGESGASDLAVSPDGSWAVASLADWGPPAEGSAMSFFHQANPRRFPEARRWNYTGDIAIVATADGEPQVQRVTVLSDLFVRAVAISADGNTVYALQGDPERILAIPVELLRSASGGPILGD